MLGSFPGGGAGGFGEAEIVGGPETFNLTIDVRLPRVLIQEARVVGGLQMVLKLSPELFLCRLIACLVGNVVQLVGVCAEVVEFLQRSLVHCESKLLGKGLSGLFSKHEVLEGAVIDVAMGRFVRGNERGAAGRPSIGLEIAEIEKVVRANRPDRVSGATGTAIGVTFEAGDDVFATGRRKCFLFGDEVEKTLPGYRGGLIEARGFEECWGEIDVRDEGIDSLVRRNPFAPANRCRHTNATVVERRLRAGERHAIVGGDDNEGILELAPRFQCRQHFGDVLVKVLDLIVVIQHFSASFRSIWKVWGNDDIFESQARANSDPAVIFAMRFRAAEPEEERGIGGTVVEKVNKVRGVVARVDAEGWIGFELFGILFTVGVPRQTTGSPIAWSPRLPDVANVVAGVFQEMGEERVFRMQGTEKNPAFADLPNLASC